MARDGGRRRRRRGGGRIPALALLVALAVGALLGWMYLSAAVVHVRPAEVYLPDLPAQFDGATALYVSDVNIRSAAEAAACARLMVRLAELEPDLLLLGGDYGAGSLADAVNGAPGVDSQHAAEFLRSLANFHAPLGKFAVLGEADDAAALADAFAMANVALLQDAGAWVERDGARLAVVGLRDASAESTPYDAIAGNFRRDDCAIVLAHSPLAYTRVRVEEASGGGAWADLVLSGHTLGGQIRLFGRALRQEGEGESERIAGWYYGDDLPVLVSQGLGCRGVKLRLGTQSEVWLLTLRRPEWRYVEG